MRCNNVWHFIAFSTRCMRERCAHLDIKFEISRVVKKVFFSFVEFNFNLVGRQHDANDDDDDGGRDQDRKR